ncbi:hypothetical protein KP509_36G067600 [Ceratopteris richardii]|uniref:Uncharacterized protein n=1 Tax=Ceratopteris richardii TaxID=49495 RepID=A0A8T2QEL1_CERRI|nr:hypothetical protein KP509_36G067600 [Ceratopteris richardii]
MFVTFTGLFCLQELHCQGCTSLTALSCLSTSLQALDLGDCCSMERLNLNVSLSNLQKLSLRGCTKLKTRPDAEDSGRCAIQ